MKVEINQNNLLKKCLTGITAFLFILLVASFFVAKINLNTKAANLGDVVINEFATKPTNSCPGTDEWYEVLNTTSSDIDLTGWSIGRTTAGSDVPLSGIVPSHGLLTFDVPCTANNDAGDILVLKDDISTPIYAVSYGNQDPGNGMPHTTIAPVANSSAFYISGTWHGASGVGISKGWFNQGSQAPSLSDLAAIISSSGITTNFGNLPDPTKASGLYFEKTGLGKITFNSTLNLTDSNTLTLLQDLGNKLQMSQDLNNDKSIISLDASTAQALKDAGATLEMYGLNSFGFSDANLPNLIINDQSGNRIPAYEEVSPDRDPDYPDINNLSYSDLNGGTLTFDTSHFTQFETDKSVYANINYDGSDKDGSELRPYTSIQTAIDNAPDGWNVVVSGGDYNENLVINQNVNVIGYPGQGLPILDSLGDQITINSGTVNLDHLVINGANSVVVNNGNVTIKNCIFNGERGVVNYSGNTVDARENYWGVTNGAYIADNYISGIVQYDPWYLDEELSNLSNSGPDSGTGPTVVLSNNISGRSRVKSGDIIYITAAIEDPNGVDFNDYPPTIEITNGLLSNDYLSYNSNNNNWYYNWTVPDALDGTVGDIHVFALDMLGNVAQTSTGIVNYTIDNTPPTLVSATAVSRNRIEVNFSEDLDGGSLITGDFQVSTDGNGDYQLSGLSEDNGQVTLNLGADLDSDTPIVTINPGPPQSIRDLAGNEQTEMSSVTAADKIAPSLMSSVLGDGASNFDLPLVSTPCDYDPDTDTCVGGGDIYTAQFVFSEELSVVGKTAVENALTASADSALTFDWDSSTIQVSSAIPTAFTKDVWVLVSDKAGNKGWVQLISTGISDAPKIEVSDSNTITVEGDNQDFLIPANLDAVNLEVPLGSDNSTLNLGTFTSNGVAGSVPEINITKTIGGGGTVVVGIPSGTTITADDPSWDGTLDIPQVTTLTLPDADVDSALEIGFGDVKLSFDTPVKLTFVGKGDKRIGYDRGGIFTEITTACIDNHDNGQSWAQANLVENGNLNDPIDPEDCKLGLDNGDLVVWTMHFTVFATFTSSVPAPSNPPASYNPTPNNEEGLEPPLTPEQEEVLNQIQFKTQAPANLSPEEKARRVSLMQGTYDYELVYQSPYPANLTPGQEVDVWVEVKNTGTAAWFNNGDNVVRLGSGSSYGNANQQRDYNSEFANSDWYSANRAANIFHPEVDPGWNTRFQFKIKAPMQDGIYKAYFTPVVDGLQWMKDIGLYWQITVGNASAQPQVPANPMTNQYTVVAGDSLSSIAIKVYGDANRWYDLVKLNKVKYPSLDWDYNLLSIGWQFTY